MLVKQSQNTYIRCAEDYGYITNQMTRLDRVYNDTGAFFLRQISRVPKSFDEILETAVAEYGEAARHDIARDLLEFLSSLEENRFIVTGSDENELSRRDEKFSYETAVASVTGERCEQSSEDGVIENTQDFFLEEVQERPLISALQFELSSRCNERCIHCYIPNKKKDAGADMPLEKVKSIMDEFAEMGGLHVTLSGGEAFLHRDLMEICEYCREKDLKISILSNLIAVTDFQIERLKKFNIALIQTSLYSMDPDVHDRITTVKGSFARTKNAIEKLVANDIPLQISCPLMKANFEGYKKVIEYAMKLKVKIQTDYIMMAQSDLDTSNLANRLSLEETEKVIRDIIETDMNYRTKTLNQKPVSDEIEFDIERFRKQPLCGVGFDNCCITVNGDVYPCAGWQDYVLGNIYEQSLKEIWENGSRVKELRKITQGNFPQCINCEALNYCNRCLVRNYNESDGDMFAIPKHFCEIAFLNKRLVEEYEAKFASQIYESRCL